MITFLNRSSLLCNCCFPVTRLTWATESPGGNPPLQQNRNCHFIKWEWIKLTHGSHVKTNTNITSSIKYKSNSIPLRDPLVQHCMKTKLNKKLPILRIVDFFILCSNFITNLTRVALTNYLEASGNLLQGVVITHIPKINN
jgi:hypothetical protein